MTTHAMKLTEIPFKKIATGQKTVESHLFDEKRQLIDIGDSIEFSQSSDSTKTISTQVTAIYRYASFKELFSDFPPECFGGTSKEFLIEEICQFYSEEEQEKYGVIGIKIELK